MPTIKANQRSVDAIKPTDKRTHYSIEGVPGLQLDVTEAGKKSWRAYAPNPAGHRIWRTIGPADAITVGRAIDEARRFQEAARLGDLDPAPKQTGPSRLTFEQIFERWHGHTAEHKKGSSRAEDRRLFERLVKSRLGAEVIGFRPEDRRTIIDALDDIARTHSPIQANRAQAVISAALSFALDEGLILLHPALRIKKRGAEQSRSRDLAPAEIRAIWHATTTIDPSVAAVIKLLMLLGLRRAEVARIERAEIDLEARTLNIRAERRKAWRKGAAANPHVVPLGQKSLSIVIAALSVASRDTPYLFPTRTITKEAPISADNITERFRSIVRQLKIPDCRLHDLRHMVKTGMTSLGVPPHVADRVQDQSPGRGSGKIYDRYEYLAEKRSALELWEKRLLEIAEALPATKSRLPNC